MRLEPIGRKGGVSRSATSSTAVSSTGVGVEGKSYCWSKWGDEFKERSRRVACGYMRRCKSGGVGMEC